MPNASLRRMPEHSKAWIAAALAWAAGYTDVACWLALYHVYVSHMTGNTSDLAHAAVSGNLTGLLRHGWPILAFIAGLFYGAVTRKAARRVGFHSSFCFALIGEIVLLSAFLILGIQQPVANWMPYLLLSLPAAAMGMQTVTVTNVNGLRVYTTYLTGSLSKMSEALVEYLFWAFDRLRHGRRHRLRRVLRITHRQKSFQHAALTAGLWMAFFTGGICGAGLEARFIFWSLLAPMVVLAAAAVLDIVRPVAAADEPDAKESAH